MSTIQIDAAELAALREAKAAMDALEEFLASHQADDGVFYGVTLTTISTGPSESGYYIKRTRMTTTEREDSPQFFGPTLAAAALAAARKEGA